MVTDKQRKYLSPNTLESLKRMVAFKDYSLFALTLKQYTMTKLAFYELCEVAIDNDDLYSLESLLDTYYQFWKQETFDKLIQYVMTTHKYWISSFLDGFIDKVNKYHTDVNAWNELVREREANKMNNDAVDEIPQETNKKNFFERLVYLITGKE